jgi:hypothetical protein
VPCHPVAVKDDVPSNNAGSQNGRATWSFPTRSAVFLGVPISNRDGCRVGLVRFGVGRIEEDICNWRFARQRHAFGGNRAARKNGFLSLDK